MGGLAAAGADGASCAMALPNVRNKTAAAAIMRMMVLSLPPV
jgi:hypothetical protein